MHKHSTLSVAILRNNAYNIAFGCYRTCATVKTAIHNLVLYVTMNLPTMMLIYQSNYKMLFQSGQLSFKML